MFCVDMAPCWRRPCHLLVWGYPPCQGGGQSTPGHWECLRVNCGHVFANTVRNIIGKFIRLTNDLKKMD